MNNPIDQQLREQLVRHLQGGQAFLPVEHLLKEISFDQLGIVPEGIPYSFYQQFYHMRIAQYDILEFSRNPDYVAPDWPDDYWPEQSAPADEQEWKQLVDHYFEERQQLCELVSDPKNDLFAPFPHGSGQTLLREAILVVEHSAYHSGQLLLILRLLGLHE
ncbi:putative damage-inducible protein DinB [Catalinimonas alkaloidigena]|uniref:DinB family protein n=1 Tax=Catalinimonas alkaloidigena TaxID=1075417 RepID=UPI002407205B|nr:DinB family protein [Catalinimonas alkaloidigena]MDF9798687.1 putative damage-inducible protein DinB [Catalinimonas alkaloidigena]